MTVYNGLRVLDFTEGIAGPLSTQFLADFGADVVKVEMPKGDRFRNEPLYLALNRNKRVVTLDLERYEGRSEARRLLAGADVAVFDANPGELERLGLDSASALELNPGLLHAWLPNYGTEGRWAQLPPDDLLLQALSGVSFFQYRYDHSQPICLTTEQCTYGHGLMAAAAISAGLFERSRTGQGRALSVSGIDGVATVHAFAYVRTPDVIRMAGRDSRGGTPNYRLYQCRDGKWIFLATLSPAFFINALTVMDLLDIMVMDGVEGEYVNLFLPENAIRAIARLDERFAELDRDEWEALFREHGVPHGPVGPREEWFAGDTVAANRMRVELEHPTHGTVAMPGVPVSLGSNPSRTPSFAVAAKSSDVQWEPSATAENELNPASELPLAGVRVLDIAQVIAGAYVSTVLANLGAEVIKVEAPSGDIFRAAALAFIATNRGKRGAVLDMKLEDGREAFYELVRQSDVVVDNFRMGVRERLGVDYASLAAINPRIITASVTGYGPEGPLSKLPGFDPILQARGGVMANQGGEDEPVFLTLPVNDTGAALIATFGICAALRARKETGRGQEVQTSLANAVVTCQTRELTWYEGRPANPSGSKDCIGTSALRRYYRCADGWVMVACSKPEHFHQLCVALGHTEWAGGRIADQALRDPRDGTLAAAIGAALESMAADDVVERLLARGVPSARPRNAAELYTDPWLRQLELLDIHAHPQFPAIDGIRGYSTWSGQPARFARTAPLLGEHTVEVLRDHGFDEARISALLAAGAAVQAE